jgi:hypothetical protein
MGVHLLSLFSFHGSVLKRSFYFISALIHHKVLECCFNRLEFIVFPVKKHTLDRRVLVLLELYCIDPLLEGASNLGFVPSGEVGGHNISTLFS